MKKFIIYPRKSRNILCIIVLIVLARFYFIGWTERKVEAPNVKIRCLQADSIIFTRIENKLNSPIYIPKDYLIQFNDASDTVHFDGIYDSKYDRKRYYYYNEFSQPVRSLEKIDGLHCDSMRTIQHNIVDFQFVPPEMIEVPAGKIYNITSTVKPSINRHYGCFRIYTARYPVNSHLDYSKFHSKKEFLKFENANSYLILNRIYIGE